MGFCSTTMLSCHLLERPCLHVFISMPALSSVKRNILRKVYKIKYFGIFGCLEDHPWNFFFTNFQWAHWEIIWISNRLFSCLQLSSLLPLQFSPGIVGDKYEPNCNCTHSCFISNLKELKALLGHVKKIIVSRPLNIEKVMRACAFYFYFLSFLQGQINIFERGIILQFPHIIRNVFLS